MTSLLGLSNISDICILVSTQPVFILSQYSDERIKVFLTHFMSLIKKETFFARKNYAVFCRLASFKIKPFQIVEKSKGNKVLSSAVIFIKNSRETPRRRIAGVVKKQKQKKKKKQYPYCAILEEYLPDNKASENSEDKRTGADHQYHDL